MHDIETMDIRAECLRDDARSILLGLRHADTWWSSPLCGWAEDALCSLWSVIDEHCFAFHRHSRSWIWRSTDETLRGKKKRMNLGEAGGLGFRLHHDIRWRLIGKVIDVHYLYVHCLDIDMFDISLKFVLAVKFCSYNSSLLTQALKPGRIPNPSTRCLSDYHPTHHVLIQGWKPMSSRQSSRWHWWLPLSNVWTG